MATQRTLIAAGLLCLAAASAWAAPACQLQDVALQGTFPDLKPRAELSGAVMHGNFLLVVSNEAIGAKEDHHAIQVFERTLDGAFRFVRDEIFFEADEDTCLYADFEGLALSGDRLYVVGSHSSSHKKQKAGNSYKKNRKALIELETDSCKSRNSLLEFRIDAQARLTRPGRRIKTSAVLHDHPVLSAFAGLPSKENGVDIEGLAAKDGRALSRLSRPGAARELRADCACRSLRQRRARALVRQAGWPRCARHVGHDRRLSHPGGPERRSGLVVRPLPLGRPRHGNRRRPAAGRNRAASVHHSA